MFEAHSTRGDAARLWGGKRRRAWRKFGRDVNGQPPDSRVARHVMRANVILRQKEFSSSPAVYSLQIGGSHANLELATKRTLSSRNQTPQTKENKMAKKASKSAKKSSPKKKVAAKKKK